MVLPPREGFSPEAVGAIGLLVHRLSAPDDLILGRAGIAAPFAGRRFAAVPPARWAPLGAGFGYGARAARLLRQTPPRLIEVHNRPDVATALARRHPGVPVTLVLHNDPQAMRLARTPRARAALLGRMGVVAVSEHLRSRFRDGLGAAAAVEVLPNCLDLSALPPPCPPEQREMLILFAGRLVADKGADLFVAACACALPALPGWRAAMIGADRFAPDAPDTPFLARLRTDAAAAGVRLLGHRPHPAVLDAMARAAIVVVPSRWAEPFGLAALEAMASGAALVASGRGGLAALAGGAALLVDPEAPGRLAQALLDLARDPAARARLGAAGRLRARDYDLPPARARLQALRSAALAGSSAPPVPGR